MKSSREDQLRGETRVVLDGERYQDDARVEGADPFDDLPAVHDGHVVVDQEHVDFVMAHPAQAFLRLGGRMHAPSRGRSHRFERIEDSPVVVDHADV